MTPLDHDTAQRLSPRMRECLRLIYGRKTSKEIAAALGGLSESTVNGYIAQAVTLLAARNRRHAAELLHQYEAGHDEGGASLLTAPDKMPGQSIRVDPVDEPAASLPSRDRAADWRSLLPLRPTGAAHNDLGLLARIGWILGLAVLLAIGFGMLAIGLEVLSRLLTGGAGR